MDEPPAVPERNDPIITVEAVPNGVDRDPGWTHARLSVAKRPAEPVRCRHRVRWRDLKGAWQFVFALVAALVFGTALLALAGLFWAVLLLSIGVGGSREAAFVLTPAMAVVSVQLLFGFAACHRTWNKLHRPGTAVCVLNSVVTVPVLVITGVLSSAFALPWLMLIVLPPLVPMMVLLYFRSALYPPARCAEYPWLPPKILAMRETAPEARPHEQ
jgi:hypothetical protein